MTTKKQYFRGQPLRYWSEKIGVSVHTIWERMRRGLPDELILAKKCSAPKPNHISKVTDDEVANDYEAWSGLTPDQLETMRDFELIGRASKHT